MCLHGALYSIPINLICNMITFRENVLTFDPTPEVEGACKDRICACMLLHLPFPLILYATQPCSEKLSLT